MPMKNRLLRLCWALALMVGTVFPSAAGEVLGREAFTGQFIAALQAALPDAQIVRTADMEVKVEARDGNDRVLFLHNAYNAYLQSPLEKSSIIETYVSAVLESQPDPDDRVDPQRIVPVVKDRGWLLEMQQMYRARGTDSPPSAYEELNDELIVLYAEDTPATVRYLSRQQLDGAGVKPSVLRARAMDNLMALLPAIELYGTDGVYMLTAGGTYEASLLLAASIWDSGQVVVDGDYVVAIPARDVLLVTGSNDPDNIEKLRRMAASVTVDTPYRLTEVLFIYRNGTFVRYDP